LHQVKVGSEEFLNLFRRGLPRRLLLCERVELGGIVGGLVFVSVDVGERGDQVCGVPPVVL
jgi:hypothetical protein